jgi:hypothetical protein
MKVVKVGGPRQSLRNRQGSARRSDGQRSLGPIQMRSNLQKVHKFRFVATTAFSGTITSKQMLAASGVVGSVVNTTAILKNYSVRIKEIEMWTPPASQGAAATCAIEWLGSGDNYSPSIEISDTSVSVTKPAHIRSRPPVNSGAHLWANGGTTKTFCNLVCPGGTIIDLSLALVENDGEGPITTTVATAVVGASYYLALDHTVSDLLVPVSLTTTV